MNNIDENINAIADYLVTKKYGEDTIENIAKETELDLDSVTNACANNCWIRAYQNEKWHKADEILLHPDTRVCLEGE